MNQAKSTLKPVGAWLAIGRSQLLQAGVESPEREAQELLAHATGLTRSRLLSDPGLIVAARAGLRYRRLLSQRQHRIPLQYLLGSEMFMGEEILVGPGVLIPRPETELLVEACLDLFPNQQPEFIADLGTGSGAIALALAKAFPAAKIYGIDRSDRALAWARRNRRRLHRPNLKLRRGDAEKAVPRKYHGRFSLVASNPPYIPEPELASLQPEVRQEPRLALAGGQDGLDGFRRMSAAAGTLLADGGFFVSELGAGQASQARAIAADRGFTRLRIMPDWQGIDRVLVAVKRDPARPPLLS